MKVKVSFAVLVSVLMLLLPNGAVLGQQAQSGAIQAQQAPTMSKTSPQPLSLSHLYYHFLVYVDVLDRKADKWAAAGRDANWLRNDLQTRLHFSDTEFAPIRESSRRLASELKPLNEQAQSVLQAGTAATRSSQLKPLYAQREAYIQAEILAIRQTLPAERVVALESFLTQFFSPRRIAPPTPSSSGPRQGTVQP